MITPSKPGPRRPAATKMSVFRRQEPKCFLFPATPGSLFLFLPDCDSATRILFFIVSNERRRPHALVELFMATNVTKKTVTRWNRRHVNINVNVDRLFHLRATV
jgi:hypothetical protein